MCSSCEHFHQIVEEGVNCLWKSSRPERLSPGRWLVRVVVDASIFQSNGDFNSARTPPPPSRKRMFITPELRSHLSRCSESVSATLLQLTTGGNGGAIQNGCGLADLFQRSEGKRSKRREPAARFILVRIEKQGGKMRVWLS
jgi:hypothetical protein